MEKKQILVTGGAGYIGAITTKKLIENGFDVVVLDSLENGHKEAVHPAAKLEIADLGDIAALNRIFAENKFDGVIDFAAYLAVGESMENPKKYLLNNVINFINLLDAMANAGCRHIIKSSTAAVYGNPANPKDFPLTETYIDRFEPEISALLPGTFNGEQISKDDLFDRIIANYHEMIGSRLELHLDNVELAKLKIPTSVYGLTKLLDEILLKKYDKLQNVKSISLRYFNVAGAEPDGNMGEDKPNPTNLMTVAIYSALGKFPELKVFGNDYETKDGTGIRDYIHVSDLAEGHVKALSHLLQSSRTDVFNLGTGKGSSVLEVIDTINQASGQTLQYSISSRRSGDPAISYANVDKAHQILNWEAKYSLLDMATTAWKWHKSHPDGYSQ